jgi:hypothetical protein
MKTAIVLIPTPPPEESQGEQQVDVELFRPEAEAPGHRFD